MKIQNYNELATTELRKAALSIVEAGLEAIDTKKVIRDTVSVVNGTLVIQGKSYAMPPDGRVIVAGVGKCALEAAEALEEILGDSLYGGIVLHITGEPKLKKIATIQGTHPLPSDQNVHGASLFVDILKNRNENDLIIFVVSGGGSTLLCLPEDKVCVEEISITQALIRAGATIQEVNTIRKHLSLARGGYPAQHAYPARIVSLIFSDVPGDDFQFIASGPTVKDTTTTEEAENILHKYAILKTCGIEKCGLVETPKDDKYFANIQNVLIVSNWTALEAMAAKAQELGFNPIIRTATLSGEARAIGLSLAAELHTSPSKTVLLYGGETTVTVSGQGRGGRNLEVALSALADIRDNELITSIASDGHDNGSYAGAICDTTTKARVAQEGEDSATHLADNDTYPFFEKIGNRLETGYTGSNVSDLLIALKN